MPPDIVDVILSAIPTLLGNITSVTVTLFATPIYGGFTVGHFMMGTTLFLGFMWFYILGDKERGY